MRRLLLLSLALTACGDDNDKSRPDARPVPDAHVDADAAPPECDYTEALDATNDDLLSAGTAETTGLSFTGATLHICGNIDNGHFNASKQAVDIDTYRLSVPADKLGILYLSAAAGALDSTTVELSGKTTATSVYETGALADTFAVTRATLVPGDYVITVSTYNTTDASAAIPYKLSLQLDPATRCAHATGTVAYPEANDGAAASGNDVYEIRYSGSPARGTTALPDSPEPTGLTIAETGSYRLTGQTSNPGTAPISWMDDYQDRDTYEITMGASTNTLSVRVNWPGTASDLDFFVFPMGDTNEIATGWYARKMEDEFSTFAVTPGAKYEVMVAASDNGAAAAVDYDLTLCGAAYTPDPAAPAPQPSPLRHRQHPAFTRTVRPLYRH